MRLVQSLSEIKKNMSTLDSYLDSKRESEYSFALKLVKKGTCFIAAKTDGKYRFYPSRFIGYADNTMSNHLNNDKKDGRETNPAITQILHRELSFNAELEKAYRAYCEHLGFMANEKGTFGVGRKYWDLG
jgi:hypothetical protein